MVGPARRRHGGRRPADRQLRRPHVRRAQQGRREPPEPARRARRGPAGPAAHRLARGHAHPQLGAGPPGRHAREPRQPGARAQGRVARARELRRASGAQAHRRGRSAARRRSSPGGVSPASSRRRDAGGAADPFLSLVHQGRHRDHGAGGLQGRIDRAQGSSRPPDRPRRASRRSSRSTTGCVDDARLERAGADALLRVVFEGGAAELRATTLADPPRLVLDFSRPRR